jgi:signal peptidase II
MSPKARWFWITTLLWVVVDQVTKFWVYANIEYGRGKIEVIPGFFNLVHAQNPGAAFSFLADFEHRYLVFLGFTVVAVGVVVDMYRKLPDADRVQAFCLGLILSGAVGNAIDRVHKRTVTDFMDFYWGTWHYPAWNVADATLLIGVLGFVALSAMGEESPEPSAATAAGTPPSGGDAAP